MYASKPHNDIDTLKLLIRTLYGEDRDELVWTLIKRFGDVRGVFAASREELCRVSGVTDRVAQFFDTFPALKRQAALRDIESFGISGQNDAANFARLYFDSEYLPSEIAVCMDGKGNVEQVQKCSLAELVPCLCRTNARKYIVMRFFPAKTDEIRINERIAALRNTIRLTNLLGLDFIDCIELYGDTAYSLNDDGLNELTEETYIDYIYKHVKYRKPLKNR